MKASVLGCLILVPVLSVAQNADRLSLLKAPSSPASVVAGIQPSSITSPKSWEAVEAAVFNNFSNENGSFVVPNDFAIEVSPYWLNTTKKRTIEDFLLPKGGQSFMQNLSFSVASTKSFMVNDSVHSEAIGFGIRSIWIFEDKDSRKEKEELLKEVDAKGPRKVKLSKYSEDVNEGRFATKEEFIRKFLNKVDTDASLKIDRSRLEQHLRRGLSADTSLIRNQVGDIIDEILGFDQNVSRLTELQKEPQGFKIEIAAAASLNFPTNKTDFSYVPKAGFWITPSYQPKAQNIQFLGVIRFFHYNRDFYSTYTSDTSSFDNSWDYGARVVFRKDRFSIEAEMIGRSSKIILQSYTDSNGVKTTRSKTDSDFQCLINFNYRLSDAIVLSYNFGRKFSPTSETGNNLVSTATLNFGIGAPRLSNISN